jgi:hypothetical protein
MGSYWNIFRSKNQKEREIKSIEQFFPGKAANLALASSYGQ